MSHKYHSGMHFFWYTVKIYYKQYFRVTTFSDTKLFDWYESKSTTSAPTEQTCK